MAETYKGLKEGDFVRYLGDDPANVGENFLTVGKVYEVDSADSDSFDITNDMNDEWGVGDEFENAECFAQVFDKVDSDAVNSPSHYKRGKFETIEVIEEITSGYSDGFVAHCAGTAIKYIARAPFKHDTPTEDLRKAAKYLEFAIKRLEAGESE